MLIFLPVISSYRILAHQPLLFSSFYKGLKQLFFAPFFNDNGLTPVKAIA